MDGGKMSYIDNAEYKKICIKYPGLSDYVDYMRRNDAAQAYTAGHDDGYREGYSAALRPRPPFYDDEDRLVSAEGRP